MTRHDRPTQRRAAFSASTRGRDWGRTSTVETPFRIRTLGLSADPRARSYIRKHLGFQLGKFALSIRSLELQVRQERGASGEPLLACTLTVWFENGGVVVVERTGETLLTAFNLVLSVAERTVRRTLDRQRARTRRVGIA